LGGRDQDDAETTLWLRSDAQDKKEMRIKNSNPHLFFIQPLACCG